MKKELTVKSQSVETSGITKDYREALCEYIWNGFEANAVTVAVSFDSNELEGVASVCIQDDGDGICYETIDDTFGAFLASNKNGLSLQLKSKSNKGKGRFSCYAFAREAIWETIVCRGKEKIFYAIKINDENKNEYDLSDPIVTITGVNGLLREDLDFEELEDAFLRTFTWYLYLNRNKKKSLLLNGETIDFQKYIDPDASITETVNIGENAFSITLIVWVEKINLSPDLIEELAADLRAIQRMLEFKSVFDIKKNLNTLIRAIIFLIEFTTLKSILDKRWDHFVARRPEEPQDLTENQIIRRNLFPQIVYIIVSLIFCIFFVNTTHKDDKRLMP